MRFATLFRHAAALLVVSLAVGACDNGGNVIAPSNELEVANAVDQFEFQVSDLDRVTETLRYEWTNTGTEATVDVSEAITGGSAVLIIRDADGATMYEADLADDSDGSTPTGAAGTWTIELTLFDASGTFNFRVQRST
jgi:hypothetical protein